MPPRQRFSEDHPPAVGAWVTVEAMAGVARVVALDARRGRARVAIGDQEWVVPFARLTASDPPVRTRAEFRMPTFELRGGAPVYHEVDLHGRYVEDALELAERGLDQAIVNRLDRFKIIHGHGSGRVRMAVREMVARHPYVESYRFGEPQEGGLACTVVFLRSPT